MKVTIIAAVDNQHALGNKGQLVTADPMDMFMFKTLTSGPNTAVIMGRKTQESLSQGYLPKRDNYVITSNTNKVNRSQHTFADGSRICYANDLNVALNRARHYGRGALVPDVYIIGGASVYKAAFDIGVATDLVLTKHFYSCEQYDTVFPEIPAGWEQTRVVPYYAALKNGTIVYTEVQFFKNTGAINEQSVPNNTY
jgi:dihydrofolate reductase